MRRSAGVTVPVLRRAAFGLLAGAAVAVAPAVEPLVRSVVAAESPKHVSRRERKEQSSNSARHHRLVASVFRVVMETLLFVCAAVHHLLTLPTRLMQPQQTW